MRPVEPCRGIPGHRHGIEDPQVVIRPGQLLDMTGSARPVDRVEDDSRADQGSTVPDKVGNPGEGVLADTGFLVLVVDPDRGERQTESLAEFGCVLEGPSLSLRPERGAVVLGYNHDPRAGPLQTLVQGGGAPVAFGFYDEPEQVPKSQSGSVPEPMQHRAGCRIEGATVLSDRGHLKQNGGRSHGGSGSSSRFR